MVLITSALLAAGFGVLAGYVWGRHDGEAVNWLAPEVTRLNAKLSHAWATIERLQRGDDWADKGIGR